MSHILALGSPTAETLRRLGAEHDVHTSEDGLEEVLARRGPEIRAIAAFSAPVPADLIERLPALGLIANFGVGYDSVAVETAVRRQIVVTNTPDVLNDDVADMAVLLLLAVTRRLLVDDRHARSGRWEAEGPAPLRRSIHGLAVGMLGLGRIGETIARRLEAFDCTIAYHTRSKKDVGYRHFADLTEMAAASDVLVAIVPGGEETRHLVDAKVLDALGPEGILVNVARGTVVDEAALVAALAEGRIGGAGLDVFEEEPKVPDALKAMDNVVLTPHSASATVETRRAMADLVVDNVLDWLRGGTVRTPVAETEGYARRAE